MLAGLSGAATTPSVVLFAGPQEYVVGEGARREARLDPEHVCALVKRRMGDAEWRFVAHGTAWSAPAVSSLILKSLVADAGFATGEEPTAAVITVPAYFGDEERRATVLAGTYANLDVVEVLSEPIAAALAYGFGRLDGGPDLSNEPSETVLVYDLGGGTFDATVIELADRRISVLAVEGDHQLGGADWDERIALHLRARFCADNPDAEDPLDDSAGSQALVLAAERAKHAALRRRAHRGGRHARRRPRHRAALARRAGGDDGPAAAPHPRPHPRLPRRGRPPRRGPGRPGAAGRRLVADARRGRAAAPRAGPRPAAARPRAGRRPRRRDLRREDRAGTHGRRRPALPRAAARRRPARRRPPRRPRRRLPPGRRRVRRAADPGAPGRGDPRRHGRVPRLRRARGERRSSAGWR